MSYADQKSLVLRFIELSEKMINDEMFIENVSKLQRAFFVLVQDGTYDAKSNSIKTTMAIHTIAMGENFYAKRDVKSATEEIRKTPNVILETRCD